MKNFFKICDGVDTTPLLLALQQQPELWNQHLLRTTHENTPHAQVDDIWLRFNDIEQFKNEGADPAILDQHESVNYPAFAKLPEARFMVFQLMSRVQGERLGRVLITRVRPGRRIAPHVDSGDHAAYYERFHIVLQSAPGCLFRADDEQVQMKTGELWWFQNKSMHEVINNSVEDRIHLIVDIRTGRGV